MTSFTRLFKIMTNPLMVLTYLGFIGFSFFFIDKPIALYAHQLSLGQAALLLNVITKFGTFAIYFALLAALVIFFRYLHKNKLWEERTSFLLLCLTVSQVICLVLKTSLGRARPELLFSQDLYGFYGFQTQKAFWSFPSGHTSTVMSLAFAISILFPRLFYPAMACGLAVVTSRVVLTQHYLGDVMMASYLALLEVGVLAYWLKRKVGHRCASLA